MWNDVRQAVRALSARPAFSLLAAGTLALGIGASATIFTVVDAVLLRPLPFREPERLVVLQERDFVNQREPEPTSTANLEDWRAEATTLEAIGAWMTWGYSITGDGEPRELLSARVSPELFPLLGVSPALGRGFRPEEGELGEHRVALLSYGLWQSRFGGSRALLGNTVSLDGEPYTVVGVMPPGFRFPDDDRVSLWTPLAPAPWEQRSQRMLYTVARLARGSDLEEARAEMAAIAGRLAEAYPDTNRGYEILVVPVRERVVGEVRPALLLLLGAVLLVLLIACANVCGLMLARGSERIRELAVRSALGASRGRVARLLLVESGVLALAGGSAGVALARGGSVLLARLDPGHLPGWNAVQVSPAVLAFGVGLAAVATLLAGLVPALHASRTAGGPALAGGPGRITASFEVRRFRRLLIVGETALSIVLLVGAGLLVRSLHRAISQDPGFDPRGLLAVTLYLPETRYPEDAQQIAFFEQLLSRLHALPGVRSAGGTTTLPMSATGIDHDMPFGVEGTPSALADPLPQADFRIVTEGYFETLGVPLLDGRTLDQNDRAGGEPVVVVNATLVERYLPPDADAIGRMMRIGGGERRHRIVGVVADVRHRALDADPRPELYVPFRQIYSYGALELVVRSAGDAAPLLDAVEEEIQALDPLQPVTEARPVEELVAGSVAERRFNLLLLGSFATLALLLTTVGIYAAIAYGVVQRTRELAVRMALGATFRDAAGRVLAEGLALAGLGIALGGAATLGLTRLLEPLLYETSPRDPWTFAAVSVLLLGVALLASWVPAWRAAALEPITALRAE